jgi:glycosyltransferase involved in cell wall biosynthesis
MRILLVHNRYQISGGEDTVFAIERAMLEAKGHEISTLEPNNQEITGWSRRLKTGLQAVYSRSAKQRMSAEISKFRPDIVHVHNFFPLLSPSIFSACCEAHVPVVQTLHNYRLLCPNALFFRDGHVCEDCLGKVAPWPGVLHACYRGSRLATTPVAAMLTIHRALKTWIDDVDVYIALTEFSRSKFVEGGLPREKILVKPNFVHPVPATGKGEGGFALFVGRICAEKGVTALLSAWEKLGDRMPLTIAGDGPTADEVEAATRRSRGIKWLGRVSHNRVRELMQEAAALIFPSVCYETFGMSIIEAFAAGTPVIASNLGAMSSLVAHGRTGLHFRAGDPVDLAVQVEWMSTHPHEWRQMRQNARAEFEAKYTVEKNYETLIHIYETAIERVKSAGMTR